MHLVTSDHLVFRNGPNCHRQNRVLGNKTTIKQLPESTHKKALCVILLNQTLDYVKQEKQRLDVNCLKYGIYTYMVGCSD